MHLMIMAVAKLMAFLVSTEYKGLSGLIIHITVLLTGIGAPWIHYSHCRFLRGR